jgi:hypothetical protein
MNQATKDEWCEHWRGMLLYLLLSLAAAAPFFICGYFGC